MAGTVTGKNAIVKVGTHAVGSAPTVSDHSNWGIADFSLTLDRGTVEQNLIGEDGNYFDQGSLSVEGSLTAAKFATSGLSDMLDNMVEAAGKWKLITISGTVSRYAVAIYDSPS